MKGRVCAITGAGYNGLVMRGFMTVTQLPPLAGSQRRGARTQAWPASAPELEAVRER